jgi:hypothetical protein
MIAARFEQVRLAMRQLFLSVVMPCLIVATSHGFADAAELRVGAAVEVITPAVGAPLAGYFEDRAAAGVHDDLHAKAIVLERDGIKAAMVVCDLLTLPRDVVVEARTLIAEKPGIPGDRVMISATHTHTGPIVLGLTGEDPLKGDGASITVNFRKSLPEMIADAVRKADAKLAPAVASAALGREEHVSFNRRYIMKDGKLGWNPMKRSPKVDHPAGPIDPDVPVLYFATADGDKPIATHVSFAMHLDTVAGERISADYPATISAILAGFKGPDMVTVFATGACGDINHLDVSSADRQRGPEEAARIGTILGGEAIKTFAKLKPVGDGVLKAKSVPVSLPLFEPAPGDFEKAREIITRPSTVKQKFLDPVWAHKILDVSARKGQPLDVEVQAIAIGKELAWVSIPGEYFAELGMDVKQRSPFKQTIIVELANGSVGYIPTKRAFEQGGYEPTCSRCQPGDGEILAETAVYLLKELHEAP